MNASTPLYFLSGPTASGKTAVAHLLAERMELRLLSVDSMMVYREMDIGTAKPTPEEISTYSYAGLNLVNPGEDFSTGKWLRAISKELDDRPTLAVGGTGLYFRALIDGLPPEMNPARSFASLSVPELQERIRKCDPVALDSLADPQNPRRLQRALVWLEAGQPLPSSWQKTSSFPVAVLRWPTAELAGRIEERAMKMFSLGLLEETQRLLDEGKLTGTAAQAIGYQEAKQVLEGSWTREEAVEKLSTRTRRYAKRQRTWFRNQMNARWVDIEINQNPELIADKIAEVWQETDSFLFDRSRYA